MGGPNIWVTLPSWLSAESLVFEAQKNNIAFLPDQPVIQANLNLIIYV